MTHIETMKQAFDALDAVQCNYGVYLMSDPPQSAWKTNQVSQKVNAAIEALRAAIAQPESEPKKWLSWSDKCGEQAWDTQDEAELNSDEDFEPVPLYTRGSK